MQLELSPSDLNALSVQRDGKDVAMAACSSRLVDAFYCDTAPGNQTLTHAHPTHTALTVDSWQELNRIKHSGISLQKVWSGLGAVYRDVKAAGMM